MAFVDVQHRKWCTRVPRPGKQLCCDHPQLVAYESDATIKVFVGGAGAGKSFWLCYEGLKIVHTQGAQGAFFRRVSSELTGAGSIMEETKALYPQFGGMLRESYPYEWTFPTQGVLLQMLHLQLDKHAEGLKSKQFCRIIVDEITDLTEQQFWMLYSRLRSMAGIPPQLLGACNADAKSFLRPIIDWWIGPDGFMDPARSGVKRYFVRPKGELIWADTPEELLQHVPTHDADGDEIPLGKRLKRISSMVVVFARTTDNYVLMERDEEYLGKLESLPPAERLRFLGVNWDAVASAGSYFQRQWCPEPGETDLDRRLEAQPFARDFIHSVRNWDLASTPIKGNLVPGIRRPADFKAHEKGNPDWSVGTRVDMTRDRQWFWVRHVAAYRDVPTAIEEAIVHHAMEDGPGTVISIEHDVGQAAVYQIEMMTKNIKRRLPGHRIVIFRRETDKEVYAKPVARAAYDGRLMMDSAASWYLSTVNVLEAFPPEKKDGKDDHMDSLSGAFHHLLGSQIYTPGDLQGLDKNQRLGSRSRSPVSRNTRTKLNAV